MPCRLQAQHPVSSVAHAAYLRSLSASEHYPRDQFNQSTRLPFGLRLCDGRPRCFIGALIASS